MKNPDSQKGIVKAIIVIIIALAILTYFGLDLKTLFTKNGVSNLTNALTNFVEWAVALVIHYWNLLLNFLKSVQH